MKNKMTLTKITFLTMFFSFFGSNSNAQFVAIMEVKDSIPGICNSKQVYALFPSLSGQVEAVCPVSEDEILIKLNAEVGYLKDHPKFKGEGMVNIIINCKGEVVRCEISNKTSDPELDKQILAVFDSISKTWKAGKLDGKSVDSTQLFSYKIKKGKITLN